MGLKALPTYEVAFENTAMRARRVSAATVASTSCASSGQAASPPQPRRWPHAAFEYARDYAKERRAFGVPIASKQAIAFMLAEMAIEIDATRSSCMEAVTFLTAGTDALYLSYQARNYAAQSSLMVTDNAVQILGGHGYIREHPVEMFLRNARAFSMFPVSLSRVVARC